jgi:hypothetical protein
MSDAFEDSLANQLVRLDQWIAETESLASHSSDEETLRNLERDLARWRELRVQYELRLGRTKLMNRFAFWVNATFWISFAALSIVAIVGVKTRSLWPLVAVLLLLLIGCGASYVVAIIVRDAVATGRKPWQFSLRSLLAGTTVIAMLLALLIYVLRK